MKHLYNKRSTPFSCSVLRVLFLSEILLIQTGSFKLATLLPLGHLLISLCIWTHQTTWSVSVVRVCVVQSWDYISFCVDE